MHETYTKARARINPSMMETSHYSAMVDMRTVYVWTHWRSADAAHHMMGVVSGMTTKERNIPEVRTVFGNIERFALSARLRMIQKALNQLQTCAVTDLVVPGPPAAVPSRWPRFLHTHLACLLYHHRRLHPPLPSPQPSTTLAILQQR
jgi:hypothetical protein